MPDVNAAPNPALEEMLEEDCPIAVIAAACRMPGAPDPATFWQRIFEGQDFTRRFTPEELAEAGIDAATAARPDYVGVGAVLDDAFDFDPAFFGYSAAEALDIDPQQRLFLACAAEALQVAGHGGRAPRGSVGVFGATRLSTWMRPDRDMLLRIASPRNFQALTGNDKDYLATRVAYKLDLSGPALTVQTACSSSLVAVHMACEQLRAGGCDMALAGGVGITFPQALGYLHRDGMIFSADGSCRPFSAEANGTGIGHGCGVVLLKRLADAEADGDEIWAVVRGSAVNNDGAAKAGFTAPGIEGQAAVIAEALDMAGTDPATIGLVEAHGTGTPLGDPIEVAALTRVWRRSTDAVQHCALGSVKSNLGHLDTAAGIASFLKAVLALRHRVLPPTLYAETPNPALELDTSPFFLPVFALPWDSDGPRRAAVSSFGIGGTNCHVVLEEAPARPVAAATTSPVALAVPALSAAGVARYAARLAARLDETDACPAILAATMAHHGPAARQGDLIRAVVGAASPDALPAQLAALARGVVPSVIMRGDARTLRLTGCAAEAAAAWLRASWSGRADPFGLARLPCPAALRAWRDGHDAALPTSALLLPQMALASALLAVPGATVDGEGSGGVALALAREALPTEALARRLDAIDRGEVACGAVGTDAAWPVATGIMVHLGESDPGALRRCLDLALWQAGLGACPVPVPSHRLSLPPMPFEDQRLYRPVAAAMPPADAPWAAVLAEGAAAVDGIAVDADRVTREHAAVAALHRHHAGRAFLSLGCLADSTPRDLDSVVAEAHIDPRFRQLAFRLLEDLVSEGGLHRDAAGRFVGPIRPGDAPEASDLVSPSLAGLIARTAPHLDAVLTGRTPLVNLVFPEGDTSDAADLYESHHYSRHLNDIAARLAGAVGAGRKVTVLEIGAGTGGTTGAVLAALGPQVGRYVFTDIGPLFLARARERFAQVPGMEYAQLDMTQDVLAQGFAPASCDLIVAANVLHNAATLPGVLRNLSRLLKPGGVLLMRELVERKPLFDIVFGALAPAVDDHEARGGLFASAAFWRDAARAAGFAETAAFPEETTPEAAMGEAIILARMPGAVAPVGADAPPLWAGVAGDGDDPLALLAEAALAAQLLPGTLLDMVPGAPLLAGISVELRRTTGRLLLLSNGKVVASARLSPVVPPLPTIGQPTGPAPDGLRAALGGLLRDPAETLTVLAAPGDATLWSASLADGGRALVAEGTDCALVWTAPATARRLLPATPATRAILAAERWDAVSAPGRPSGKPIHLIGAIGGVMTEALSAEARRQGRDCVLRDAGDATLAGNAHTLLLVEDLIDGSATTPSDRLRPVQEALAALARAARAAPDGAGATIITRNATALPGETVQDPLAAVALGMGLSLAREASSVPIALLDTDLSATSLTRLLALPPALSEQASFGAIRRGQAFRRRFAALPDRADIAWSLPTQGTIVVTGGLSRLGRTLIDWLGGLGLADVTLFLHREPTVEEQASLSALREAHGLSLHLLPGIDCADPAAIARGFRTLDAAATAPRAVFHLAGIVRDGLMERQGWDEAGPVLAVKLNAAAAIIQAMTPHPGAPVVFFSSLAAVVGPPGEGAHAGANAALEAMARHARSQGIAATAIAWDYWRDALRDEHRALAARFVTQGLSNGTGLAALAAALAQPEAVVVAADPAALALLNGAAARPVVESTVEADDVLCWLRHAVARLVGRPASEIDDAAGLIQLGIDSLMFLDLGERAGRELGVTLSAEAALGAENLKALAETLRQQRDAS